MLQVTTSNFSIIGTNYKRTRKPKDQSSSHRKANPFLEMKPMATVSKNPNYLVVDATLPSHVFRDRSLFTTYFPSRKLHRTVFGTDIVIEGTGDVHVRVVVNSTSILFRFRDSWHVPSSPHHLFSCSTIISLGHQVMIAGHSPRMIFSHKRRLIEPRLPKYIPFTRINGIIALKFDISFISPESSQPASPTTQPTTQSFFSSCHNHDRPFASLAFHQSLLPLPLPSCSESSAPVTIDFKSKPEATVTTALVANFNILLDSGCAHHIIRDRSLFSNFVSRTTSVGTATFGSLEALGSGDVVFRYPYADHHVTFTLRGCLFAPTAPINLLSVDVLVERRGMSCLFSPAGITKVFFPSDHPKLPGLVFRPSVTNRLSFLTLVFIPPASIPNPSVFPVPSCPIPLPTIPADSSTPSPSPLPHTTSQACTTAGQAHNDLIRLPGFCTAEYLGGAATIVDFVENRGAVVAVDVVAGIGDDVRVLNGGVEDPSADGGAHALGTVRTDACLSLDDDASITSHGGADAQPDVVALVDVTVDATSSLAFSDFEDSFILRSSSLFSPYISSLTSTIIHVFSILLYLFLIIISHCIFLFLHSISLFFLFICILSLFFILNTNLNATSFSYFPLSFSCNNSPFLSSTPFLPVDSFKVFHSLVFAPLSLLDRPFQISTFFSHLPNLEISVPPAVSLHASSYQPFLPMQPPPNWVPPFQGPPPIPTGVIPQQWQAGYWQYNPAYNYQRAQQPQQQYAPWIPSRYWGVPAQQHQPQQPQKPQQQQQSQQQQRQRQWQWQLEQQQQPSHNPYKRMPRPPSAEYLTSQLSDNPLSLSNMIRAEDLYEQSQLSPEEFHTPWIWNPTELAYDIDEFSTHSRPVQLKCHATDPAIGSSVE